MTSSKQNIFALILIATTTLFLLFSGSVQAQTSSTTSATAGASIMPLQVATLGAADLSPLEAASRQESFMANYPGGAEQLTSFLKANVEYPELAKDNNFEGTTIVRFKVLEDGSLDQFTVQQSTHDLCDQAVIKALKTMDNWVPAQLRGKTVSSWRAVAVDFKMTF